MPDEFRATYPKLPGLKLKDGAVPTSMSPSTDDTGSRSLRYDVLCQTNPTYDAKLLEELEDLYVGGYRIAKRANRYLMQMPNEHEAVYGVRCKAASYTPYFGSIVDQFASDLFGQPISIHPAADADNPNTPGEVPDKDFYSGFASDADRQGTSFLDLMKCATTTALKKRCAIVAIDAPEDDPTAPPPETRAEEEQRGTLRLYAYEVPLEQLIDWECDEFGGFTFAILRKKEQRRAGPRSRRDTIVETFTVWTMGDDGNAAWERHEIAYKANDPPKDETLVPVVASGTTSFRRIPLLCLDLPPGLWVGNKIGPQAKEHYQRRSALVTAEYRSMVAIPHVKLGPEITSAGEAMPSEIQQNAGRGKNPVAEFERRGFMVLGKDDAIDFAEPKGHCYELVDRQLNELKDEMYRVNHQMAASVSNKPSSIGRSGLSKQKDHESTAKVLRALGEIVRGFAVQIYETIAEARGENVIWTAHGLDSYEVADRQEVLEEAIQLDAIQIPSVTFKKAIKYATAQKLLIGVDPNTLATIKDEIEDGVEGEHEIHELKQEVTKDALENPEAAVTQPVQPVKPNAAPAQKPAAPKQPKGAPKKAA